MRLLAQDTARVSQGPLITDGLEKWPKMAMFIRVGKVGRSNATPIKSKFGNDTFITFEIPRVSLKGQLISKENCQTVNSSKK